MPTPKKGARLGGSAANQRKILSNLAGSLFEHGAITTTDAKAKALRPYAEKLITKAKRGTLADIRQIARKIPHKGLVQHLVEDLAPQFEGREGGYTRIIKVENRSGDNAPMSRISLVLEPVEAKKSTRSDRVAASQKAEAEAAADVEEAVEVEATEDAATEAPAADTAVEADSAADSAAEGESAAHSEAEAEEK